MMGLLVGVHPLLAQRIDSTGSSVASLKAIAVIDSNHAADQGSITTTSSLPYWTDANRSLGGLNIRAFAVSGAHLFVGTESGIFSTPFSELGNDSWQGWTEKNSGLVNKNVLSLTVSADGTRVFAGTSGGVYVSMNNGTIWSAVNSGLTSMYVNALAVSGPYIFAATLDGVFVSSNDGGFWSAVNTGLQNLGVYTIAVSGSSLYAGTDDGVFRSTNNGASWSPANTGLSNTDVNHLTASGANLFLGTFSHGVFISPNSASNWTASSNGLTNRYINALTSSGSILFTGTNSGIFLTPGTSGSGVSSSLLFHDVSTGLPSNRTIRSLAVAGEYLVAGTYGGGVWKRSLAELTALPVPPSASSPAMGSIGVAINTDLIWNASAGVVSYQLQIGTDPSFTSPNTNADGLASTTFRVSGLTNNTTYYWRVRASNIIGRGAWSEVMRFTTIPLPEVKINKQSLAFGNSVRNIARQDTLRITNGTLSYLQIESIAGGSPSFTYRAAPALLSNSDTLKLIVSFTPSDFGIYSDT
ncbi:MAG TPA: hypothetical protein VK141_09935, partial [Nitrosomonas sp.]|nr:hypothetical protein [Nitrosomonas sp.]